MKILKKSLALFLCFMCALSCCVFTASAEAANIEQTDKNIYFEVPENWNNWKVVFCHIWPYGGDALASWQGKKEKCTQVEGNLYSYDPTKVGGLKDGVKYCVIFSVDTGMQTYETVMSTECLGDTLYCDGTVYPVTDYNKDFPAAFWRNQDSSEYGPLLYITSIGQVIGTCPLEPASDIFLNFITSAKFDSARIYSGKTDQQIIDNTATALGLTGDEVEALIEESGATDILWKKGLSIVSLEIKPVTISPGTNGHIDEGFTDTEPSEHFYYHYDVGELIEYTVTFGDGTVKEGKGDIITHNNSTYRINTFDDQYNTTPWEAGNTYQATASLNGVKTNFSVTIEESPVEKIEVSPLVLAEDINGHYFYDYNEETNKYDLEYFKYSLYNIPLTITFKDGTVITDTHIEYEGAYYNTNYIYTDQSYQNAWTPGNTYTAYILVSDRKVEVPVKIVENPIKNFEVVKSPDKTVFDEGEVISPKGAVIRINYTDNTYEDITLDAYNFLEGNFVYIQRFDKKFYWDVNQTIEDNFYTVQLLEYDIKIEGKINPNTIKELTIQEQNADLSATLTYSDNTTKTVKILGMSTGKGYGDEDVICTGGLIFTDDGIYNGEFYTNLNLDNFYMVLDLSEDNRVTSNTLSTCLWWKLQQKFDDIVYSMVNYSEDIKSFDGQVTAENIDSLLNIACHYGNVFYDENCVIDWTGGFAVCKADSVKTAFYNLFGVMPDLTLSKNYNAETNTIKLVNKGLDTSPYEKPFAVESNDGTYTAQIHWGRADFIITLNEDLYLTAYNIIRDYGILGDANGDKEINIKDATMIQKYIAKLTRLSNTEKILGDVNGDEDVNIKDATAIQKFIAGINVNLPVGETVRG